MNFSSSNYPKSTLQTGIKENAGLFIGNDHAAHALFSFSPGSKGPRAIVRTNDHTNRNVESYSTRGTNASSRFDPDISCKINDVSGSSKIILSDSFNSIRGRGNSSNRNLSERCECDLNHFSFGKGSNFLKKDDSLASLNISSSTAVLGNYDKHFGDGINPFDLPSPIETLISNPLETQLLANVRKSTNGSSGYASCLPSEFEYSKQLTRNVSSYNYQPNESSYCKYNHDTTAASCSVFSDPSKLEFCPFVESSKASSGRYNIETKSKYPDQDRTFLKQELIGSPDKFRDIFTNAVDSPYLAPQLVLDSEDVLFGHGSFLQDTNEVPISNTTSMPLFDSESFEKSYIPTAIHNRRTRNCPPQMCQKVRNFPRPIFGNFNEKMDSLCKFCITNKEPKEECYHRLKDDFGLVTCPVLYTYICDICGATGSYAHTRKHCPRKKEFTASMKKDNRKLTFEKWRNGIVTVS